MDSSQHRCFFLIPDQQNQKKKILRFYLFIFREKGREGERDREKHQVWEKCPLVACPAPPAGDLACNPGVCPDQKSNWQLYGLQDNTQLTEPRQSGQKILSYCESCSCHFVTSTFGYLFWNLQFEHFCSCIFWGNWVNLSWRKQNVCMCPRWIMGKSNKLLSIRKNCLLV